MQDPGSEGLSHAGQMLTFLLPSTQGSSGGFFFLMVCTRVPRSMTSRSSLYGHCSALLLWLLQFGLATESPVGAERERCLLNLPCSHPRMVAGPLEGQDADCPHFPAHPLLLSTLFVTCQAVRLALLLWSVSRVLSLVGLSGCSCIHAAKDVSSLAPLFKLLDGRWSHSWFGEPM